MMPLEAFDTAGMELFALRFVAGSVAGFTATLAAAFLLCGCAAALWEALHRDPSS
ncbi:MAG: hypothetical protein HY561_02320 [Gemmatimonadetes bacterium]|nr:hypothetical protein [Gemmatimonadota bacterium]